MKAMDTFKILINILVFIIIFLSPGIIYAQADSISSGDVIRVNAPKYFHDSMVGNFISIKIDSLYLQINKRLFTIPLQQITKFEVSRGKRTNTKNGAIIGGFSGGLGLGLIAAIGASGEQEGWSIITPGQAFLAGLVTGSLIGSVTGAIIGSGIYSPRWVEVTVDSLTAVQKSETELPKSILPKQLSGKKSSMKKAHPSQRRWRFSVTWGTTGSGPAKDVEQAMIQDGFNETSPGGWFGGPTAHPFSRTGFGEIGVPWSISVRYELNNFFDLSLLISKSPIGSSYGYHSNPTADLDLNYTVTSVSPMLSFNHIKILQLGMGPGLFMSRMEKAGKSQKKIKLGAVFQAELVFPEDTRFFVKLDGQFRYVGKSSFGPFTAGYRDERIILTEFKADFSHFFVGLGIGIHK